MSRTNSKLSGCPICRGAGVLNQRTINQVENAPLVDYSIVKGILGETRVLGPEFCPKKLWTKLGLPPRAEDIPIPIRQRCLEKMRKGGTHEHVSLFCVPFFLSVQAIAECYPRLFGDTEGLPSVGENDDIMRPPDSPDWIWYAIPKSGAHIHPVGTINVARAVIANMTYMRTFSRHLFPERVSCRSVKKTPFPVTVMFGKDGVISIPRVSGRVGGHLYAYGVKLQ